MALGGGWDNTTSGPPPNIGIDTRRYPSGLDIRTAPSCPHCHPTCPHGYPLVPHSPYYPSGPIWVVPSPNWGGSYFYC